MTSVETPGSRIDTHVINESAKEEIGKMERDRDNFGQATKITENNPTVWLITLLAGSHSGQLQLSPP